MYNGITMFKKTFHGGVFLSEHKESTVDKKIKTIPAPEEVILPLTQHTGEPNKPVLSVGDEVKLGQRVGSSEAFISSPVHSPVSGKIKDIRCFFNPIYGKSPAVIIQNDGRDKSFLFEKLENPENLTKEKLIERIKEAGIVGLGGAAFPTHVKLSIPEGRKIDTLIVNGAECEPYLTCDHRLMVENTGKIIKGIHLTAGILEARNIIIAIEENKLSAIFSMQKALKEKTAAMAQRPASVSVLKTKYPQGGEKQLVKVLLGREIPPTKLPLNVGVVVQNVGTCLAIYEAVYEGKPLTKRCVTLTGNCLKEPGNFSVCLGTLLKDAVAYCGGFTEKPEKIIAGGPMMGVSQYSLDVPIIKGITGVIFLSKKEAALYEELPCIRCAKCVDICPVRLVPTDIMRMVKYSRWHYLEDLNPSDCMECGACAYTCPSRTPLVQYIKLAKAKKAALLEKKEKDEEQL